MDRERASPFSFRLPYTRCEDGILKTVEFVNELPETESILPGHVLLHTAEALFCWTRLTVVGRLAAEHLRRRHRGNRRKMNYGTCPCDLQKLVPRPHTRLLPYIRKSSSGDTRRHKKLRTPSPDPRTVASAQLHVVTANPHPPQAFFAFTGQPRRRRPSQTTRRSAPRPLRVDRVGSAHLTPP